MTDLQDAPTTKEKIIGKKLTLFIYSLEQANLSRQQFKRILFGSVEQRAGTGKFHKKGPYSSVLSEHIVETGRVRKKYFYRGILSTAFCLRPLPYSPVLIVKQKDARKIAAFFDQMNVRYIQFEGTLKRVKDLAFWVYGSASERAQIL
jgi:hypothetical protein